MNRVKKFLSALVLGGSLFLLSDSVVGAEGNESLVEYAEAYIGVPYKWGGTTPSGFDCSGFMTYVFKEFGVQLPRTSADQYYQGEKIDRSQLVPGDLVFFTTYKAGPSHAGIYVGDNNFIHASSSKGVIISSLDSTYYKSRYLGARRYIQSDMVKDAFSTMTVKNGQIGMILIEKKINLWERDENGKLQMVRVLNPGEVYRVYGYDDKYGGQYNLGSQLYITNMSGYIQYRAVE